MTETSEHAPTSSQQPCLDHFNFCDWSLFRISDFVIRICLTEQVNFAYWKYFQHKSDNKQSVPTPHVLPLAQYK